MSPGPAASVVQRSRQRCVSMVAVGQFGCLTVDDLRLYAGTEDDVGRAVPTSDGNHGSSILGVADLADDVVHFVADDFFFPHVHRPFLLLAQFVVDVILNRPQQVANAGSQHRGVGVAPGAAPERPLAVPVRQFLDANFALQDESEVLREPFGSDEMGLAGDLQVDISETGHCGRGAVNLQVLLIHEHGVSSFK